MQEISLVTCYKKIRGNISQWLNQMHMLTTVITIIIIYHVYTSYNMSLAKIVTYVHFLSHKSLEQQVTQLIGGATKGFMPLVK